VMFAAMKNSVKNVSATREGEDVYGKWQGVHICGYS